MRLETEADIRRAARRRVGMKMGFYTHALVFVLVNLGLYVLSNLTGEMRWHRFPLWGWGLGLAIHGIVTFISLQGMGMKEQMIEREMERLRKRPGHLRGGE